MVCLRLFRRLAALVGALALLCALGAAAETATSLRIDFSVQPGVIIGPGDVTMTFVITNETDHAVRNITLSSSDGLLSEPIGQLAPGESQTLSRPHSVTQEELDAGRIAYTVSHNPAIAGDDRVVYPVSAAISQGDAQPGVDFTRRLSSDSVTRGGLVTVTYKISNTGNVALNALRIRDILGDFTGRQERLGVGESKTFISRVTLAEAAVSEPVLEYVTPSGESFTRSLDAMPIDVVSSALDISFSVGRSVFDQDTADASLILTNRGGVDYTGITVLDDVYGGVIADAISLPSGGSPAEIAHAYPLRGEAEYRWRITGASTAGEALDLRTDTLTLSNVPDEANVSITLDAAARTPRINRAGQVTFDFAISNDGTVMARDALLYEVNRGEIRRLAVIPTGEPMRCSASYSVESSEPFIFCLSYTDAQDHQRTVTTTPIDITIAPDGASPERPGSDGLGLEGDSVKPGGNSATFIVLLIIAGAALTVMITIMAVASVRARRERSKRIAAEKQRVKEEMGRTGSIDAVKTSPKRRNRKKPSPGEAK
ncbi:MAG: hypothetical protein IJ124_02610 [Clostridia bacterium]|nr:hypothetical protein [Clostridia bacterium]